MEKLRDLSMPVVVAMVWSVLALSLFGATGARSEERGQLVTMLAPTVVIEASK